MCIKKKFKLSLLSLTLMLVAFQCGDDCIDIDSSQPPLSMIEVNPNSAEIAVSDTIWLSKQTTSKIFSSATQDSIVGEAPSVFIRFYRLQQPAGKHNHNAIPASGEFVFVASIGSIEADYGEHKTPLGSDERVITPVLSNDSSYYSFKIGLIPKNAGYFALYCEQSFGVDDFHRDLYAQFDSGEPESFYPELSYDFKKKIDDRLYFFKAVSNN